MERTETDTRQRLNNKIEHLEAELASMKARLDQEVAQRHNLGRSMDVCVVIYTLYAPKEVLLVTTCNLFYLAVTCICFPGSVSGSQETARDPECLAAEDQGVVAYF